MRTPSTSLAIQKRREQIVPLTEGKPQKPISESSNSEDMKLEALPSTRSLPFKLQMQDQRQRTPPPRASTDPGRHDKRMVQNINEGRVVRSSSIVGEEVDLNSEKIGLTWWERMLARVRTSNRVRKSEDRDREQHAV